MEVSLRYAFLTLTDPTETLTVDGGYINVDAYDGIDERGALSVLQRAGALEQIFGVEGLVDVSTNMRRGSVPAHHVDGIAIPESATYLQVDVAMTGTDTTTGTSRRIVGEVKCPRSARFDEINLHQVLPCAFAAQDRWPDTEVTAIVVLAWSWSHASIYELSIPRYGRDVAECEVIRSVAVTIEGLTGC